MKVNIVRDGFILGLTLISLGILAYNLSTFATLLFLVAGGFTFYFFRDPERITLQESGIVVSPADGRVDKIQDMDKASFVGARGKLISILLSPFDVHVTRMPIDGTIEKIEREHGKKIPASRAAAFYQNERNHILVRGEVPVAIVQITGVFARRIVCWAQEGMSLKRGEKLGMIRFGSRTNLLLPANVDVVVKVGDKVKGSETVIARIRETDRR